MGHLKADCAGVQAMAKDLRRPFRQVRHLIVITCLWKKEMKIQGSSGESTVLKKWESIESKKPLSSPQILPEELQ